MTPRLRAVGKILDPVRIFGSCLLARATERRSGRALSQWYGKVLRFPITRSLPLFPVSHPAGSPRRFAQAQFTVSRKWPQAESVVIRNSQAVPGRCSRVAVDMGPNTEVGFGGRSRQRSGQLRDWRPESNCPSDQIQLESRWLFPHPSAVGNYGQFSAARVRGRLGGRQHLSECTQKSDECCAAAPGIKSVVSELDIFISSAVIALDRMNKLKNNAFVGHTGHFDNAINLAGSEVLENRKIDNTEPRKICFVYPEVTARSCWVHGLLKSSMRKWRDCAVLHPVQCWPSRTGVAALTVDGKMAKMHISRPGPAVVRRFPGRSVPGQRRTENPR